MNLGIFRGEKLITSKRFTTRPAITPDECFILLKDLVAVHGDTPIQQNKITGIILSSVVPSLTSSFEEMARKFFHLDPLTVSHKIKTGIKILYQDPSQVGADRIANSVAAYSKFGGPIIALDIGTATTFDVVSKDGKYLGGVIAPGLKTSADHLIRVGARLPQVVLEIPESVIGRTTETSVQSGVFYGTLGQIKEILQRIRKELNDGRVRVVATGGLLPLISKDLKGINKNEHLTLEGLRILYILNRGRKK